VIVTYRVGTTLNVFSATCNHVCHYTAAVVLVNSQLTQDRKRLPTSKLFDFHRLSQGLQWVQVHPQSEK